MYVRTVRMTVLCSESSERIVQNCVYSFLFLRMTSMSPLGCMTPNPIRSRTTSGCVVQPSSIYRDPYVKNTAINSLSSTIAMCL